MPSQGHSTPIAAVWSIPPALTVVLRKKPPKESKVESAFMAANSILMAFMINLSQVILFYGTMFRRCVMCEYIYGFLVKDKIVNRI